MSQTIDRAPANWWQLTLPVPQRWAEDASASLIEAGALGVQTLGDSHEPIPKFASQGLLPQASGPRLTGQVLLLASYTAEQPAAAIRRGALDALASLRLEVADADLQLSKRSQQAWAESWKQYFKPLKIGRRLWVVPSWDKHFVAPQGAVMLQLDPGMAFGTGQHATTALCLRAIERLAERLQQAQRPLPAACDLGSGSGILAIYAAKLGFSPVTAIDLDPDAVAASGDNAVHTGVALQVIDTPIEQVGDTFGLLVANILAQPLIDMADAISARLRPGGILIVSGILQTQADEVQCAFEKTGILVHQERWTQGEWSALSFRRIGKGSC